MTVIKCIAVFFYLLLSLSTQVSAQDLILEQSYLEDPSNAMTWQQVQEQTPTPYSGLFSKGYSASTFWLRLKIAGTATPTEAGKLILRLEPTYVDEVQLFDPLEPTRTQRFVGDRHDQRQAEYRSLVFNFVVPTSEAPRYLWLRLKTTSTNLLLVRALSFSDEQSLDQKYQAITSMAFALVFLYFLWGLVTWLVHRDPLLGIFSVKQGVSVAYMAAYVGYFRLFLGELVAPAYLDYLTSALVLSATFTAVYFHYAFLKEYIIKPFWRKVFWTLLLATPLEMLLILSGRLSTALTLNMLVVLIASPLMLFMVLFGINWSALGGKPSLLPKSLLVGFYWLFCAVTALTALPSLGFKSISNYAPHFVLIHGFLTGTLMVVLLHFRVKRVEEEQHLAVRLAQHEAQQQKQQRDTERNFLEMLTHEFRTSLSVIRMAIGSGVMSKKERSYADNAILSMDQVIERCQQVQQLADGQLSPQQDKVNLPALLKEWVAQSAEAERIQLELIELPRLSSDEKLLKIVIGNLLDNALKYSLKGSTVRLALAELNGKIRLEVSSVPGPAGRPDPDKVFQKYYRNEKAHGFIGSGLGLYIIKNTVRLMGGDLRYEPTDELVKFQLWLPR